MPRMIFHNLPSNLTIGVEVDSVGNIYASLAACNRRDQPTRRIANTIVNGRLDKEKSDDKVFIGNYTGESITKDVYGPIRDTVRKLKPRRSVSQVMNKLRKLMGEAPIDYCSGSSCSL